MNFCLIGLTSFSALESSLKRNDHNCHSFLNDSLFRNFDYSSLISHDFVEKYRNSDFSIIDYSLCLNVAYSNTKKFNNLLQKLVYYMYSVKPSSKIYISFLNFGKNFKYLNQKPSDLEACFCSPFGLPFNNVTSRSESEHLKSLLDNEFASFSDNSLDKISKNLKSKEGYELIVNV
jgi:2-oxoglutarate dehydrogenase complex dehydrogenase (E1) component-like enzyme